MNGEIANLIQQWQSTGNQYAEAFKNGLKELALRLHLRMLAYARRLHELGFPLGLGLPPTEQRYIQESLKIITANPLSSTSRALITEIPAVISRNLNLTPTPKNQTLRGFETYDVAEDGSLSLPEKTEEPHPKLPEYAPIRNHDLEKWRGEKKNGN